MVQISRKDKEKVLEAIRSGKIDTAEMALPAPADSIVLTMKQHGFTAPLEEAFKDKRSDNMHTPPDILLTPAVTAKLKQKTSLTDIPFAVTDAGLLAGLGRNAWDYGRNVNDGLFSEILTCLSDTSPAFILKVTTLQSTKRRSFVPLSFLYCFFKNQSHDKPYLLGQGCASQIHFLDRPRWLRFH